MAQAGIEETQTKRAKISRAQSLTMLEVLAASLILGTCVVVAMFLLKYIKFNAQVIGEKNEAITEYDQTLRNVGVCIDRDKNGRLNNNELENCNPSEVTLDSVAGSLRYNVLSTMAKNEQLESVARKRNENCYDEDGKRIDFNMLYSESKDDDERREYLQMEKICSALRVIPDALPAHENTEALMASLNQIFILTGREPERLAPRDEIIESNVVGTMVTPVSLRVEGTAPEVVSTLLNVERSIRQFDVTGATVEWTARGLSLQASANAYYLDELPELETMKTVTATTKKAKAKKK